MIKNYGQRVVKGKNEDGFPVVLPIQIADVNKVLGSAREMVEAGNRVVLDRDSNGRDCSYIEHKSTGRKTTVREVNGAFQFQVVVPRNREGSGDDIEAVNASEGFPRPGTLATDLFY